MRTLRNLGIVAALATIGASGCYRASVDTGLPATNQVVVRHWAPTFLWGIISKVDLGTGGVCPNGVSHATTQFSPLNVIVGVLTAGIYSPMDVRATCATAGAPTSPTTGKL
jgi:hypothetical protein